jgi:hypothetical protein
MFTLLFFPPGPTARTIRGERPVKTRHPQSANSTDVIKGSQMITHHNHTTTSPVSSHFYNPNGRQKNLQICLTLEFSSMAVPLISASRLSPLRRQAENRLGPHWMRDHEDPVTLFNPNNPIAKGVFTFHERKSAGHRLDLDRLRRKPARAARTSGHASRVGLLQIIQPARERRL